MVPDSIASLPLSLRLLSSVSFGFISVDNHRHPALRTVGTRGKASKEYCEPTQGTKFITPYGPYRRHHVVGVSLPSLSASLQWVNFTNTFSELFLMLSGMAEGVNRLRRRVLPILRLAVILDGGFNVGH